MPVSADNSSATMSAVMTVLDFICAAEAVLPRISNACDDTESGVKTKKIGKARQGKARQGKARQRVTHLVRKAALRHVPVREFDGGFHGTVANGEFVVAFHFAHTALDDLDGLLHAGFLHSDGFKPPHKRLVLFHVLFEFLERGGTNAPQRPGRHGRL